MKKILVAMLALSLLSACAAPNAPVAARNAPGSDAVSITAPDSPHPSRQVAHGSGH